MNSSNLRKTAVLIHGISPKDQKWILSQLPITIANEIRPLLKELRQLGIPKDDLILKSALETAKTIKQKNVQILNLNARPSNVVFTALKSEPLCLARSILAIYDWSWSADVKSLMVQSLKRKQTKTFLSSIKQTRLSDKKANALLEVFGEKLSDIPVGVLAYGGTLEGESDA